MYITNFKANNEKRICKKIEIKSLGNIPLNNSSGQLFIENNSKANIMRYIKDIRTNIINYTNEPQVISIFSSYAKEGKSLVANNIAVSLARINKKVLLVDGNLRNHSSENELFYTEKVVGLSDFIREIDIENKLINLKKTKEFIKKTQFPNLYTLSNGTITEYTSEIIRTKKMRVLLNLLKEIFEYIIIDGTSFFENSDCIEWSTMVDTNILVIEENKVSLKDLIKIKEEIEYSNGDILGFILNKTSLKHGKYYSKIVNSKYGIFIDNYMEEAIKEETLEDLISPIVKQLEEKDSIKFDVLHKEIKDEILIEDFINDIENNFNILFDNLKNNYEKNTDVLLEKIIDELQLLKKEVTELKSSQKIDNDTDIRIVLEKLLNKNYDDQFEYIKKYLQDLNYNEQIEEMKERIKHLEGKNKEIKKSNIIDLRKIFLENRRKNNNTFSIDEPIAFEDLERLAVEIIEFDEPEKVLENINSK